MRILLSGIFCVLLSSCSTKQVDNSPISHFGRVPTKNLEVSNKIDLESFGTYRPFYIKKDGDSYFIFDYSRTSQFKVLNRSTLKYKQGVDYGNGPGELIAPAPFVRESEGMTTYEINKNKRYLIVEDSDSTLHVEEYQDVGVESIISPAFHDNYMAAKSFRGESWIKYYMDDKEICSYGFPDFTETRYLTTSELTDVFRSGNQQFKPDGTKLAVTISNGCVLAIFDCDGNTIKERALWKYFPPVFVKTSEDYTPTAVSMKCRTGFAGLECTDSFVYTLYAGKIVGDDVNKAWHGSHVFVYDWDGNPVAHYELEKELFAFGIDEKEELLYGIGYDPEGCILEYKL